MKTRWTYDDDTPQLRRIGPGKIIGTAALVLGAAVSLVFHPLPPTVFAAVAGLGFIAGGIVLLDMTPLSFVALLGIWFGSGAMAEWLLPNGAENYWQPVLVSGAAATATVVVAALWHRHRSERKGRAEETDGLHARS